MLKMPRGRPPTPGTPKHDKYVSLKKLHAAYEHNPSEENEAKFAAALTDYQGFALASKPAKSSKLVSLAESEFSVDEHESSLPPMPPETDEEILARLESQFDTMQDLCHGCCQGQFNALAVYGRGGVGKTYTAETVCEYYKEKQTGFQYYRLQGYTTAVNLYLKLWEYRHQSNVLIIDDADAVFDDETGLALLKAATDTGSTRKINWLAESKALVNAHAEKQFVYNGSIIFLTNKDLQAAAEKSNKLAPHFQALLTRLLYLDLGLRTDRELMLWIDHVVTENGILIQKGLKNKAQQAEVLSFMKHYREKFRNLSIRLPLKLAQFYLHDPDKWKEMAMQFEFRTGEKL